MPKIPIDYSKSIIYKIVCKDINIIDCYVGSTTDFIRRRYYHKFDCNNETRKQYKFYVYQFIRENGGWDNWDMIEIEKYNAIDKNDLHKKERFYIEELKATLNKIIPTRTIKEWEKDNKETRKEIIKEKNKKYRETYKEIIKEKKKEYNETHKEILKEKKKEYLQKNSEKINCPCGSCIVKYKLTRHEKSKKHLDYLACNC